ncbi:hypothetical protein DRB96_40250 [Streptomyces sp. ICC1]|nr:MULTISPECIES: hypothetical protein [unclassified Streptomyces]AWZ07185.1 hypothetical protein DRB89_24075 [Streptomyces sp. ICC4]AWZ17327.1 hypothetical protein DRB96_40250 [Streptomyces sp. ICC1]
MSKAEHETGPQGALVCPVCKHTVPTAVQRRHKTLGVFVPVWGPGPCHNPDCPEYLENPQQTRPQDH